MVDEGDPTTVGDEQDIGDVQEMQPRGITDEGEHTPSIIEEMEREDQELEEAIAELDSSDEEGNAPIPTEWRNF